MCKEIRQLILQNTWKPVNRLELQKTADAGKYCNVLKGTLVFKLKCLPFLLKFLKARYCVHGDRLQTEGVNYFEIYLMVVRWSKFWNWLRVLKGSQYFLLSQTLKGYNILDPRPSIHQKAIPFCILEKMFYSTSSSSSPSFIKHHAMSQTSYGAFFHGMCSCKYSKTFSIEESKQTKILVLKANHLLHTIKMTCTWSSHQQILCILLSSSKRLMNKKIQ